MDFAAAFVFFISSVIFVLYHSLPMSLAMFAGFIAFFCTGLHRGFSFRSLLKMSIRGAIGSLIVVNVLLTIGVLTGLWRSAGTFAILTAWGLRAITPSMFVLAAFVMSCILSYALGTSFGTVGTLGLALMTLARSGGVDPIITAGAIMSGIHFGDRGSPSSSCVHLVRALTGTDLYTNIKAMMRAALLPLGLTLAFYLILSINHPLVNFSGETLDELSRAFNLSPVAVVPALIMLALPMFRINIFIAFLVSILAAFGCTVWLQGYGVVEALGFAVLGLHAESEIRALFNGGGLLSMVQTCLVLMISGTYSGIFGGTGMLDVLQERISSLIKKFGAYPVTLMVGTMTDAVFCNQTVGVIMTTQLVKQPYSDNDLSMSELALDLSNATVITAPLVPWCIACSVPLSVMGVGVSALPYASYLYLIPMSYLFTKKRIMKKSAILTQNPKK